MPTRTELSHFLRSRRGRIRPEDVGLAATGRRRTPGLRRPELAHLAGISADYYVRLEQGRGVRPSTGVLESLAAALGLSDDERDHLFTLARDEPAPRRAGHREHVRPSVHRLLQLLNPTTPAFVVGRRLQVLAWNGMAAALITDFDACPAGERNIVRHGFRDPAARRLYVRWEEMARTELAHLRVAAGRYPDDPVITALVDELRATSAEFRLWWACHDVEGRGHGRKELDHPLVGRLTLDYESLAVPGAPDQHLVTYTAPAGSPSAAGLDHLACLTGNRQRPARMHR
ncbi:helix-turn-helix transcriptional regulator [Pseudonocardia acaciae]|uniref:helix-turn-helix transcriptional regulator n=1 Tax=Pseudonocardia acaciae TaxID=551276 RepID=UPI00055F6750|nr:helix-turn-helix transcriptional regulator [Pseudonocardia acaciae]